MSTRNEQEARAWFDKGDSDLHAARLLLEADPPEPDIVAFHSQQGAEKYLKGFLVYLGVQPPRTHDLILLLDLIALHQDGVEALRERAEPLSPLAVQVRYPFDWVSQEAAAQALEHATTICQAVRIHVTELK